MELLDIYRPFLDLLLLQTGFAISQYLVLRAGVFSVATVGFAALGAYGSALLTMRLGLPPLLAILAACGAGGAAGLLLAWPLARLRGVYQAITTLAFVQIVLSLNLYAEGVTGGPMGLNGIPKSIGTLHLVVVVAAVMYLVLSLSRSRLGRAFEAVREDEAMAASVGISITFHQSLAFMLSGAIAGLFGGLEAFHGYALDPNQFGFGFVVTVLSYVVLGGRRAIYGPLIGTAILVALPELARPLADQRMLVYGVLLMLVTAYLPRGVADTVADGLRRRRLSRTARLREQRA